ncbi:MAG: AAA family ATPase [Acidobacteriota bacterium]
MPQASKTFRIFVSSTFSDLKEERNALQRYVFPRLRELCARHGCRFQAIDLRWGVREEAALDQRTLEICFDEIARCQRVTPRPNFLVLLGDRYGWRPLPAQIPAAEFEQIDAHVADSAARSLLLEWYRRDDNAVPPLYCLQPRSGEFADYAVWRERVEQPLRSILLRAVEHINLEPDERVKYSASATEQEIVSGALRSSSASEHVFCFFRRITNPDDLSRDVRSSEEGRRFIDVKENGDVDEQARALLDDLKRKLESHLPNNVRVYDTQWASGAIEHGHIGDLPETLDACLRLNDQMENPPTFCVDAWRVLSKAILGEVARFESVEPLAEEIAHHRDFGRELSKFFIGRSEELQSIADYIVGGGRHPLVIHGASGSGKSALLASAIERVQGSQPNFEVLARFIGATPVSVDGRALLEGLCREVSRRYGEDEAAIPADYRSLVRQFASCLTLATAERPLVIFLDALDQLSGANNSRALGWLPVELPEHVHLIASTLPGECLQAVSGKLPSAALKELKGMSPEEGRNLLDLWLADAGRTLQTSQSQEVMGKFARNGLPLNLRLAFEVARRWKSYNPPVELSDDIDGMIHEMFGRLSEDHGGLLVSRSLGFLAAARSGLTEDEMLDVLAGDDEVYEDFCLHAKHEIPETGAGRRQIPVVVWSRLYFDLEPYLTERSADGTSLLAFYHRRLNEVAAGEFLREGGRERHESLARYFARQALWLEKPSSPNLRKLSELPHQLTRAELWRDLEESLCDLSFIEAKCAGGMAFELVQDYSAALDVLSEARADSERRRQLDLNVAKYAEEIVSYARSWTEAQARHRADAILNPSPQELALALPEVLRAVRPVTDEEIEADCERIASQQTQVDRIRAFQRFVSGQAHNLVKHAGRAGFCAQQAHNLFADGPVGTAASGLVDDPEFKEPVLLLRASSRPSYDPHPALLRTLTGHTGFGRCLALSADGELAVSRGSDATLRVWDTKTGRCLQILEGHTSAVNTLAITPDGRVAISGGGSTQRDGKDFSLRIWDLASGRCIKNLEGHSSPVESVSVTADGRIAASADGKTVRVWDVERGLCLQTVWPGFQTGPLAATPEGRLIVMTGNAGKKHVTEWDLGGGQRLRVLPKSGYVKSFALSADGLKAVGVIEGGRVRIWDLSSGQFRNLEKHASKADSVSLTPDGRFLACLSTDGTLALWDLEDDSCVRRYRVLRALSFAGAAVALSADARLAVTSGLGALNVWDIEAGRTPRTELDQSNSIAALTLTGPKMLTASSSDIDSWDTTKQARLERRQLYGLNVGEGLLVTPDGRRLVSDKSSDLGDGAVVWDLNTALPLKTIWGSGDRIKALAITPDGRLAVSGGEHRLDGGLSIWDIGEGKFRRRIPIDSFGKDFLAKITTVQVTADGRLVVACGRGDSFGVWDLEKAQQVGIVRNENCKIQRLVLSGDARTVLTFADRTFQIWDLRHRRLVRTLPWDCGQLRAPELTGDGKLAVATDDGRTLYVVDVATGRCVGLAAQPETVSAFGVRGNTVVTGDGAGSVRFLEMRNFDIGPPWVTAMRLWRFGRVRPLHRMVLRINSQAGQFLMFLLFFSGWIYAIWRISDIAKITGKGGLRGLILIAAMGAMGLLFFPALYWFFNRGFRIAGFQPKGSWDDEITAACRSCGMRFAVSGTIIDTLEEIARENDLRRDRSPMLGLPDEAWADARLESRCPHCDASLRFNPFIVDSDWLAERIKQDQETPIRARDLAINLAKGLTAPVRDPEGTRLRRKTKLETRTALKQAETYAMAGNLGEARRILESLPDTNDEKRALLWRLDSYAQTANTAERVVAEAQRLVQEGRIEEALAMVEALPGDNFMWQLKEQLIPQIEERVVAKLMQDTFNEVQELVAQGKLDQAAEAVTRVEDRSEHVTHFKNELAGEISSRKLLQTAVEECQRLVEEGRFADALRVANRLPDTPDYVAEAKSTMLGLIVLNQAVRGANE